MYLKGTEANLIVAGFVMSTARKRYSYSVGDGGTPTDFAAKAKGDLDVNFDEWSIDENIFIENGPLRGCD